MLSRLFDRVLITLAGVAAVSVVYLAVSVDYEVIVRYFFNRPTRWVIDFTEYALLYILFFATAWVLAKDAHVKIDILLIHLPTRVQRVLNIISSLVGLGSCALFFWFSLVATWVAYEKGELLWNAVIIPKWPIWVVMPIGSLLLTIQFLRRTFVYFRGGKRIEKGEQGMAIQMNTDEKVRSSQ